MCPMHLVSRTSNVDQGPAATKASPHDAGPIPCLSIPASVPLDPKDDFPSPGLISLPAPGFIAPHSSSRLSGSDVGSRSCLVSRDRVAPTHGHLNDVET